MDVEKRENEFRKKRNERKRELCELKTKNVDFYRKIVLFSVYYWIDYTSMVGVTSVQLGAY